MVSRAAKHILNSLLRDSSLYDHPHVVAHFFNCLVGNKLEPNPTAAVPDLPAGVSPIRKWTSLTPTSLRSELQSQVAQRFRYNLSNEDIDSIIPVSLLRELCMRVGIQLVLRTYEFGSSNSTVVAASKEEEKHELNGDSTLLKKKKKKASGSKAETVIDEQKLSVRPEDVINLYPIVKVTNHLVSFNASCNISN